MDQTDSASYTWKIPDFSNLSFANYKLHSHSEFPKIDCKQAQFWLSIEYDRSSLILKDHCKIILIRTYNDDFEPDLTALWRVSLINQNGDECLSRDIETGYSETSRCYPIFGGSYKIDQNYIRDPSNCLLTDGSLIIKCQITVLGKSLKIDHKKFNLNVLKTLKNYESLLESSTHSDVVLVVGNKDHSKEFNLHKAILSAQSPVFKRMFEHSDFVVNKQNRVEITDDVEVFEHFLHFIYGGNITSLQVFAADLLGVADKYQVDSLKQLCEQTLFTVDSIDVDTVTSLLTLADMHNAGELKSKCIEFITANASEVIDTEGWKQMDMNRKLFDELYRDIALSPMKKQKKK